MEEGTGRCSHVSVPRKTSLGDQGPLPTCTGQQGADLPCFHTQDPRRASMTQALRAGSCAPAPSWPQASGLVSQPAGVGGLGAPVTEAP